MQESETWVEISAARFRVKPLPRALRQGYLRFVIETQGAAPQLRIAPAIDATPLAVSRSSGRLRMVAEEADIEPIGAADALRIWARAWASPAHKAHLRLGPILVRADAGRRKARIFGKFLRSVRAMGLTLEGAGLRSELAFGWPQAMPAAAKGAPASPRIAVALHLHYVELWPEISGLLRRWGRPLRLFVSLTRDDALARARIMSDFPDASVECVENRGRDVRPFLIWLESGRLDEFDLVCKIHGKRTLRPTVPFLFGDLTRRAIFLDLISDEARVNEILARFAAEPRLGLVGPERFHVRSGHKSLADVMGRNGEMAEALAGRMGAPLRAETFDFFSNTMFWVRPQALAPLRDLRLAAEAFAPEAGQTDGALEHAVERLFNHAARTAGFFVEGTTAA